MLPYQSMAEAETVLGRRLTGAETVWFQYTVGMHDFWLYSHSFAFLILVASLVPLPMALLELTRPKSLQKYKLQPKIHLPSATVFKIYKDVIATFFLISPLLLLSYPANQAVGIRSGLPLPSAWEVLAQLVVYFLVEDYANYWIHRILHTKWGYEKIHRIHHQVTAPVGFAAPYAHWAEVLVLGVPSFLGPAMVPGHIITFWLWMILRHMEAIETHCGYDFPQSPTKFIPFYGGAEYHDYHHFVGGQSHCNFASVFTYCDYIYGTDKGYRHHKKILAKVN